LVHGEELASGRVDAVLHGADALLLVVRIERGESESERVIEGGKILDGCCNGGLEVGSG